VQQNNNNKKKNKLVKTIVSVLINEVQSVFSLIEIKEHSISLCWEFCVFSHEGQKVLKQ